MTKRTALETRESIRVLFRDAKWSKKKIAKHLKVGIRTVRRWCNSNNLKDKPRNQKILSQKTKFQLKRDLKNGGSLRSVGRDHGICAATVRQTRSKISNK